MTSQELRKCSCCSCTMLLETYFSKNRKGEYLKTCLSCRERFKKRNARADIKVERKTYRDEHKEERVKYDKEYRKNNPEIKRAQQVAYFARPEIQERRKARSALWYQEHGKEQVVRDRRNKYRRDRTVTDINYKITTNLRSRLSKAIAGTCKSAPTLELLGCSVEKLKQWLEDQFEEGMSWDNYGEWHIDHEAPCSSFDLTSPFQQRLCFHWANLQPLWAADNMSKGARIIE